MEHPYRQGVNLWRDMDLRVCGMTISCPTHKDLFIIVVRAIYTSTWWGVRPIRLYVNIKRQNWQRDKHMMRTGGPILLSQRNQNLRRYIDSKRECTNTQYERATEEFRRYHLHRNNEARQASGKPDLTRLCLRLRGREDSKSRLNLNITYSY